MNGHIVVLIRMVFLVLPNTADDLVHALDGLFVDGRHASTFLQNDNIVDVHNTCVFWKQMYIFPNPEKNACNGCRLI